MDVLQATGIELTELYYATEIEFSATKVLLHTYCFEGSALREGHMRDFIMKNRVIELFVKVSLDTGHNKKIC